MVEAIHREEWVRVRLEEVHMKKYVLATAAGLGLALMVGLVSTTAARPPAKPAEGAACNGDFGTSILFEDSPKEAAARALKEEKLVMVLHISGHFEDPKLT